MFFRKMWQNRIFIIRSSRLRMQKQPQEVFHKKKVFLKTSQNSRENTCARVSNLKSCSPRHATLSKKRLWHICFPVSFVKFLRTLFYRTPLGDCFCRYSSEQVFLKRKRPVLESLFNKFTGLQACETPTQVFSFEICELFKNTFLYRTPPLAASV